MIIPKNIIISIFVFMFVMGCDESPTEIIPPDTTDTTATIAKSAKRGLSFNLRNAEDLDTLKGGVSWWYNWYFSTDAPEGYYDDYQMEFIPMLWGGNTSIADRVQARAFILDHPEIEYLLVMNEPNLVDQANRTPAQAVEDWLIYEQFLFDLANDDGRELKLVGPAMNWGTLDDYWDPVVWLDAFYAAYQSSQGREPRIDYLAFHWYDYGLSQQLDRLQKYGKQIWITEMANWNANIDSYSKQIVQMTEMVGICESREDVFRYAWFIGRGGFPDNHYTYLFNLDPGDLNDLGHAYINLPYAGE
ncbi:MAG: hypothetical protein HN995_12030 [Candidatus Marinimicrobia bacterium]|jgi:hypothetical protein|nr:hypothetical protein [Candidatus Neomarinimicrobiota bacterium]MBT3576394.1 hypothetical protein [Candidatus Neomarinimicrobiota bacterium]MBT3680092.1 hypothetical protein [Candidatus Neomarinimicrobiota bacterium]MBT3950077.1 hypothetical protein [Candidatus Neomarinimicrobiota bacterium]MBT4254376.1 hypothetical protein [Candidatus Neomarinimicrobiota bacterium]